MNREFYEGFETRDLSLWDGVLGSVGSVSFPSGISGMNGYCLHLGQGVGGGIWRWMAPAQERYYHVKFRPTFTSPARAGIFEFYSGSTLLLKVKRDWDSGIGDWALGVWNASDVRIASTGIPFPSDRTYRIEVYHKVHPTQGMVQVRVDGDEQISFFGNTTSGSITTCNKLKLACDSSYDYPYFDDLVTDLEEWVGEAHLGFLRPIGEGSSSQWMPSSPLGWACVDETPVSSVDFVKTLIEALDLYQFSDPPGLGSNVVKGLQYQLLGALTGNPAAAYFRQVLKSNGIIDEGDRKQLPLAQKPVFRMLMLNPTTNRRFTEFDLVNLELGLKAES